MKDYVVDTLVRRRCFVEAKNKREAERLAKAIVTGQVVPLERPYDVDGSEILAGVYTFEEVDWGDNG